MEKQNRLIDANALKSYIDCGHLRHPTEKCFSELDVVRMLDKQPTVDAVPVVRCRDCKHWFDGECGRLVLSSADDYCSYGERVGEEE